MRVLIIEDENGAAKDLFSLLNEVNSTIQIMAILQSVQESIDWIKQNPKPDLGFFDIRLADGDSFEIFNQIDIDFPVVFTTAYDEYALRAFKVNSIDYLLKPVSEEALSGALKKYQAFYQKGRSIDNESVYQAIKELQSQQQQAYKKSFLIRYRDRYIPININEIAFIYVEFDRVFCYTFKKDRYSIEQSLDQIENQLNPQNFYRVNRQFIVSRKSIVSVSEHFNRKLKMNLKPEPESEVLVSKSKSTVFKKWLEEG